MTDDAMTSIGRDRAASSIAEGDDRWRLFSRFPLPFAGGKLGRIPARLVYWREQAAANFARFRSP